MSIKPYPDYPEDLRERVGRLLMIGFEGETLSDNTRKLILDVRPGGVILFKRNVGGGPRQVADLTGSCRDLFLSEIGRPPLVAIDQEGGPVKRLGPPFFQPPSQREMAGPGSADGVRRSAETVGRELKAVGINFNLTPVLDLSTDPEARFMFERSFSHEPETAAKLGAAVIEGHRRQGVLTCAKHFPGIGATRLDPHEVLPTVDLPEDRLRQVEMAPFADAIRAGVPAVMTSHIRYPSLDPERPATFSHRIITGLLRETLGFGGLILTDDMEMGAIVNHFQLEPSVIGTVLAGSDLVLICHQPDRIRRARDALVQAVQAGRIDGSRIGESNRRLDAALALAEAPARFAFKEVFPFA